MHYFLLNIVIWAAEECIVYVQMRFMFLVAQDVQQNSKGTEPSNSKLLQSSSVYSSMRIV